MLPEPRIHLFRWEDSFPIGNTGKAGRGLERLFRETAESLLEEALSFSSLLPDEARPLEQRIQAPAAWCRGFVIGLAAGSVSETARLSPDLREIVEEMMVMGEADSCRLEEGEEDERSYMELVEYLRMAVQMMYPGRGVGREPRDGEPLY